MSNKRQASKLIAEQAMALCGTDFRLHGRDRANGLDCIGLAQQCLEAAHLSCDIPNGYSVRSGNPDHIISIMEQTGFRKLDRSEIQSEGDIILVRPSLLQVHFMIKAADGFVHADAGLGRVVHSPGPPQWPVLAVFRLMEN